MEAEHQRICLQCGNGEIESELHFLLRCNRYQQLREEMFGAIQTTNNTSLEGKSEQEQWQTLMSGEKKPGLVSDCIKKFVRKAMRLRET